MSELKVRSVGGFLLTIGIAPTYFFAYLPHEAARAHQSGVELYMKADFLIPVSIMFGTFLLLFGKRGKDWIQIEAAGRQKLTAIGWGFTIACFITGIALHEWLKKSIEAFGYRF